MWLEQCQQRSSSSERPGHKRLPHRLRPYTPPDCQAGGPHPTVHRPLKALALEGSVFGVSPESLNLAREQQNLNFAKEVAGAEALKPGAGSVLGANVMGARGVQQLGNLFGVQDPLMQRVTQQQQLLSGVDFTNMESLTKAAQQASQLGRPDIADELSKRALDIRTKIEEKQLARDTQLQIARENIQGRLDAAKQRGADQKEIAQIMMQGRQEIAALMAGIRIAAAEEKKAEKEAEEQKKLREQSLNEQAEQIAEEIKRKQKMIDDAADRERKKFEQGVIDTYTKLENTPDKFMAKLKKCS
mgnify:CR=1 FL=1